MYGAFKSIPDFMPDTDQASVESRNGQLTHHCVKCEVKLFVCQAFSMKVLIGDTIFMGPPFYIVFRATRRSARLQGKGSTHFSVILRPGVLIRSRES